MSGFTKVDEKVRASFAAEVKVKNESTGEEELLPFVLVPRLFNWGDPDNPVTLPELPQETEGLPLSTVYSPFLRRPDDWSKVDQKALSDEKANSDARKDFAQKRQQWVDFYSGHASDYYCFSQCCPGLYSWFRRNCSCAPCNKGQAPIPDTPAPQTVNCCCCCCPCSDLNSNSATYLADMQNKYYPWAPESSYPGYPPHIDVVPNWEKYNAVALFNWNGIMQQLSNAFDKKTNKRHTSMSEFNMKMSTFFPDNLGPLFAATQPNSWWNDINFGMLRMQGFNPVWMQHIKTIPAKFPVDMKILSHIIQGDAAAELAAGKFYLSDYAILDGLDHAENQIAPASMCLMYYDFKTHYLRPVAIQLEQKLKEDQKIWYPNLQVEPVNDWAWRYAKSVVNASDWNTHEIGVHLTGAHLVEEVLAISTHRQLPPQHAVYGLTVPHYEKTLSINILARSSLISQIVEIGGFTTRGVTDLVHRYYYEHFDFQRAYLPNDLKARGFVNKDTTNWDQMYDEVKASTPAYLYAFDGLRLWRTIGSFVKTVLDLYYPAGDQAVTMDQYLQNWAQELKSKKLNNFPCPIQSISVLTDAVTSIIYNATVLHSAVNYLQWYYMGYVALIPGSILGPLPNKDQKIDEQYLATHLPGIYQEEVSRAIAATLSSPSELPIPSLNSAYLPKYAEPALTVFKNRLYNLHLLTQGRDQFLKKLGRQSYLILDPDQVANSIQI